MSDEAEEVPYNWYPSPDIVAHRLLGRPEEDIKKLQPLFLRLYMNAPSVEALQKCHAILEKAYAEMKSVLAADRLPHPADV